MCDVEDKQECQGLLCFNRAVGSCDLGLAQKPTKSGNQARDPPISATDTNIFSPKKCRKVGRVGYAVV